MQCGSEKIIEQIGKSKLNFQTSKIEIATIEMLINYHQEESRIVIKESLEKLLEGEALEAIGVNKRSQIKKDRRGYLHSSYKRAIETTAGIIQIKKPKVRMKEATDPFRSKILPYYERRTEELSREIIMVYFLGSSCRKTLSLIQNINKISLSPAGISRVIKIIEGRAEKFHRRQIENSYRIIWIDAMGQTVRNKGREVLLLILGEDYSGRRELIDYRVAGGETEENYENFLNDLYNRGLKQPELFVHDGHIGLTSALKTIYPYAKQQVCIIHKRRDVLNKTSQANGAEISEEFSAIYSSKDKNEATRRQREFIEKWKRKEPFAVKSIKFQFNYTITFYDFDRSIINKLRTNNPIERYIEEIRRRTIPMRYFQNEKSFDRLIFGIINILEVNLTMGVYQRSDFYFHPN
jgi:putative transposase